MVSFGILVFLWVWLPAVEYLPRQTLANISSRYLKLTDMEDVTIRNTIFRQISATCVLTDTLVNSGGPGDYFRGFPAISAHFGPISAECMRNIPSLSAGGPFIQARTFSWRNTVITPKFNKLH